MKETERRLREMGYEVVPFFLTDDVWNQGREFMFCSMANGIIPEAYKEANQNCESFGLNIWPINFLLQIGSITRFFVDFVMKYFLGLGRASKNCQGFKVLSPQEFEKVMKRKREFVSQVSNKWQKTGLSALICPAYPNCAFKREHTFDLGSIIDYSIIWTVLDFPTGVLPVTKV